MTPVTLNLQVTPDNVAIVSKFLLELFPTEETLSPTPIVESEKPAKTRTKPKVEDKAEKVETEEEPSAASEVAEEKKITLSDVREKALLLSKAGKQDTLKALFKKHGGARLTEIDEAVYPALLTDLEAAING